MQILEITTGIDSPLYCPFTGEKLFDEGFTEHGDSTHLQGVWISEALDIPSQVKGRLKEAWDIFDSASGEFEDWLRTLELDGHFAIRISHSSLIGLTTWYVFQSEC